MKKFVLSTFICFIIAIGWGSFVTYKRYSQNRQSAIPYPYYYTNQAELELQASTNAPILIIGDRMGKRLSLFKETLIKQLSKNLSKPIKVDVITKKNNSFSHILHTLKNLKKLPVITIIMSGSTEFYEDKFHDKDLKKITDNFKLYNDLRVQSLLQVFPKLSRFVYTPVHYKKVSGQSTHKRSIKTDIDHFLKTTPVRYKLLEQELSELFSFLKQKSSLAIAITQPINLEIAPTKSCSNDLDEIGQNLFDEFMTHLKNKDYKSAYNTGTTLSEIADTNAKVQYLQGKASKAIGKLEQAKAYLEKASALECQTHKGNIIHNMILKKAARKSGSIVFDFHDMLYSHWGENILFESKLYPQNIYYQKLIKALSFKIKKILRL